ncbi:MULTISPECIES: ABC transporter substrate-binding protein [unclassified Streptomyces]|uniref:ABC transporter substrate-binding protein n=1 Tax=unclassified Streptomyces TaxID=2593676 RepID=UPI0007ED4744|nr:MULTISPECIES: extracellular solute-binding protein [unclassified Streptomyces]MCP3767944.1 extracellular solute-binding protein [Streptomyces sp. MAR25Y5]OBQ53176.1 sugar-binding protein [Streptomyces sp. H-KF8]
MKTRARLPRLVAGGATLTLALTLSACGGGDGGASADDGKIHVLVYGDATNKVEKKLVDTFNKTSDVKVVLDTIPGADYQKKLQTIISTPQAPDVFFNWGGGSIKPFVKADLLMPLDDFIKKNPDLEDKFLPSVFNNAVVDGKPYGIPMRGTQPVLLFHNKKVLDKAGVTPPKTWDELLDAVGKLKDEGVTPIALGGGDIWPTQMWFQYLFDRVAGPGLFEKAVGGDKSAWESADSKKALSMIRELVDAGAFGKNYDSVKYTNGGSVQLVSSGKAGFELMGSWYYSQQLTDHEAFAEKDLGYTAFPTVEGGKGDSANVAGNTNNYYSVMKKTKHPEAVAEFLELMYSDDFVKTQLDLGNLPTTTNTDEFIDTSATPEYSRFQYDLVADAPSFQLSWDQAYPQKASSSMHKAIQQFFNGQLDADGFIQAMQALPTE